LNEEVLNNLADCFLALNENKNIRSIILTGAGNKAFVAGADIKAMSTMKPEQAMAFAKLGHKAMNAVAACSHPVIAAVNGFALGGGCELALACDFIYASDNAVFGLPETKLGLYPGFGGTQRLTQLVGIAKAKELIFSAAQLKAECALAVGIINKIFPQDQLLEEALKVANTINTNGPLAVSLAKKVLHEGQSLPLQKALENECEHFAQLFKDEDHLEGLTAFIEKREANFTGK